MANIYENIYRKSLKEGAKKPYDPADYDDISGKHKNAGAKAIESFLMSSDFKNSRTADEVKTKVHAFIEENNGCGMSPIYLKKFFDRLDSQRTVLGAFQQAYGIYMAGSGLGAIGSYHRESTNNDAKRVRESFTLSTGEGDVLGEFDTKEKARAFAWKWELKTARECGEPLSAEDKEELDELLDELVATGSCRNYGGDFELYLESKKPAGKRMKENCYIDSPNNRKAKTIPAWVKSSFRESDEGNDLEESFIEALGMTDAEYFVTVPFPASDGWVNYDFMEMDADTIADMSCDNIEEACDIALNVYQEWVDEDEDEDEEGEYETAEEYLYALGYNVFDREGNLVFHAPAAIWGEK